MKTTENNKLIAEFMGGILSSVPNLINLPQTMGDVRILCVKGSEGLPNGTYKVERINELKYHTSWDWLMPVVAKITRDETLIENEYRESIMDVVPYGIIEDSYYVVVEFIKWHNKEILTPSKFICGVCGDHVNEYTYNEDKDVDECNNCKED